MRKVISLLLVLVMAFSVSSVAFAADDDMTGKTVILHSNDVHGAIEGYAGIAAIKADYEARGAEVIMVDAGDFSQGTTYVSVSKGLDAVELMNLAGYDYACLGNHEFDYGYEQLQSNLKEAEFTVLCSDVLGADGKPIYAANDIYTTKSGVKVGFFGLETPEAQTKANPALIKGLTFLTDKTSQTIWQNAQVQIDDLKANGADVIIAIAHLGVDPESSPYLSYDLYKNTKGIDYIIDGHSHTIMLKGENGEPIQSTGTKFENVGVIVIDDAAKKIESNTFATIDEKDAEVEKAANAIKEAVDAAFNDVFAKSEVDLNGEKAISDKAPNGNRDGETNSGDLITDAMKWFLTEKNKGSITEVDADHIVAITNGGGIRAWINKGDVTKNDVLNVLPFGNTVSVIYVTGEELLEALEASTFCTPVSIGGFPQVAGMKFTLWSRNAYDANKDTYPDSTYYGPASINRVTIDEVNGKPFSLTDKYAVLTNDFCAGGGDTYYAFAAATNKFDTGFTMDAVVVDYITEKLGGVIGSEYAEPQGRITICDKAERLSGDTRIETAVAISNAGWAEGAENVILASSQSYADALAATPLAYALDAPVLLTGGKEVETAVADELTRLGTKNVYIVGGSAVIGEDIDKALSGCKVERIAGETRYETAVDIAEKLDEVSEKDFDKVIFVSGQDFPDALSVGSAAALSNAPILYVSKTGALDDATAEFAKKTNASAYLIGGPVAVSDTGMASIVNACGNVSRVYGEDRYDTAEKVAEKFASCFGGESITVATGTSFPDALAGGVLAAKNASPMLLTAGTPNEQLLAQAKGVEKVTILGGEVAISSEAAKVIDNAREVVINNPAA